MKIEHSDPTALAKRAFFLAYEAAGGPFGMGLLQARSGASEEDVWTNVVGAGDYPGGGWRTNPATEPYGDYVFGRMLKLQLKIEADGVVADDFEPRGDYQAWSYKYRSYAALLQAAADSLSAPTPV